MKKKFGQRKGGQILKSVGLGLLDTLLPVKGVAAGAVEGIKRVVTDNKNSEIGGVGKTDKVRLITSIGVLGLIAAVIFGLIDIKMFKELLRALMDL